jgi:hypothetical protein
VLTSTNVLEQLAEEGYVVIDDVLDPTRDFAPLLDEYNCVLDGIAAGLVTEGALRSTYADLPFEALPGRPCFAC